MNIKKICIIGSGMGGGILANEISKYTNTEVYLMDIYEIDKKPKENTKSIYNNEFLKNKRNLRSYGFGGSSELWHGVLAKFKIKKKNNLKSEKIINDYLGIESNFFNKEQKLTNIEKIIDSDTTIVKKKFLIQKKPLRINYYLKKNKKIIFIENSIAIKISNVSKNKVEIEYNQNNNHKKKLFDVVVLSCGTFETTRLLMQSYEYLNLNYKKYNLGSYLRDHPWVQLGFIEKKNKKRFFYKLKDQKIDNNIFLRTGFEKKLNKSLNNHCFRVRFYNDKSYENFKIKLKTNFKKNKLFLFKQLFNLKELNFCTRLFIELFFSYVYTNKVELILYFDQSKNIDNKISLKRDLDKFGRRKMNIKWFINNDDKKSLTSYQDLLSKIFRNTKYNYKKNTKYKFNPGYHFYGTLRNAHEDKNSILNGDKSLKEIKNAYVSDLSIYDDTDNSNPSYELLKDSINLCLLLKKKLNLN